MLLGQKWRRESCAWDLVSLVGIYGHRFSFKYITACGAPKHRGRDGAGSVTAGTARKPQSMGLDWPASWCCCCCFCIVRAAA